MNNKLWVNRLCFLFLIIGLGTGNFNYSASEVNVSENTQSEGETNEGTIDTNEELTKAATNTTIEKSIINESYKKDNILELGETVTYQIVITNPSTVDAVYDIAVRDGSLESIPRTMSFDNVVNVSPSAIDTTGKLTDADFVINTIPANGSVTLTYDMTYEKNINSEYELLNVATDDGSRPDWCESDSAGIDCSEVTIDYNGDTYINKSLSGLGLDKTVTIGDRLEYTITIWGMNKPSINVPVRDSLLESIDDYPWLTYNGDFSIEPKLPTSGDITDGTYVINRVPKYSDVAITYSFSVGGPLPVDMENLVNVATNLDVDPESVCNPETKDCVELCKASPGGGRAIENPDETGILVDSTKCGATVTPIGAQPSIEKEIINESLDVDGVAEKGEDITYQLTITNNDLSSVNRNVSVRDSMLENLPDYITYNEDLEVSPSSVVTNGNLTDGSFVIKSIPANSSVELRYSIHIGEYQDDISNIGNLATINGEDPSLMCDPVSGDCGTYCNDLPHCAQVEIPVAADTEITKSIIDDDGIISEFDTLNYVLDVTNSNSSASAYNVSIRDSMLENIPDYLTYNDDLLISPASVVSSGNLTTGDLVITEIGPGQTVTLSYSMTVGEIPDGVVEIVNLATDKPSDPVEYCTIITEDNKEDCSSAIVNVELKDNLVVDSEDSIDPDNKGKDDKDDAIVEIGTKEDNPKSEDSDYEDMTLGQTGAKGMLILIDMVLILGVATILKKRMA